MHRQDSVILRQRCACAAAAEEKVVSGCVSGSKVHQQDLI